MSKNAQLGQNINQYQIQQGLAQQQLVQNNSLYGVNPYSWVSNHNYPMIPNVLSITERKAYAEKEAATYEKYKKEVDTINSLSTHTVEILKLVKELNDTNDFDKVIAVDKYVRALFFNNKLNQVLEEENV